MTSTRSFASSSAVSPAFGSMSMTFAPMGLSVIERAMLTCSSTHESGAPPHAMMPRPPASLTAPARLALAMRAIAP